MAKCRQALRGNDGDRHNPVCIDAFHRSVKVKADLSAVFTEANIRLSAAELKGLAVAMRTALYR